MSKPFLVLETRRTWERQMKISYSSLSVLFEYQVRAGPINGLSFGLIFDLVIALTILFCHLSLKLL